MAPPPGEQIEARVHLFEALPGTLMPEIYRLERSLTGMGAAACSNCSSLHPLTRSAAAARADRITNPPTKGETMTRTTNHRREPTGAHPCPLRSASLGLAAAIALLLALAPAVGLAQGTQKGYPETDPPVPGEPLPRPLDELPEEKQRLARTTTLLGVRLSGLRHPAGLSGLTPIVGCWCVQDTPENPCPCVPILWLPSDKIFGTGRFGRQSRDGRPIEWFRVASDARLLVDRPVEIGVREYAEVQEVTRDRGSGFLAGPRRLGSTLPSCGWDISTCTSERVEVECGSLPGGQTFTCEVPKTVCDYVCTWPNGSKMGMRGTP